MEGETQTVLPLLTLIPPYIRYVGTSIDLGERLKNHLTTRSGTAVGPLLDALSAVCDDIERPDAFGKFAKVTSLILCVCVRVCVRMAIHRAKSINIHIHIYIYIHTFTYTSTTTRWASLSWTTVTTSRRWTRPSWSRWASTSPG